MDDLVERLRGVSQRLAFTLPSTAESRCKEAADRIEKLEALIEKAADALEFHAEHWNGLVEVNTSKLVIELRATLSDNRGVTK